MTDTDENRNNTLGEMQERAEEPLKPSYNLGAENSPSCASPSCSSPVLI